MNFERPETTSLRKTVEMLRKELFDRKASFKKRLQEKERWIAEKTLGLKNEIEKLEEKAAGKDSLIAEYQETIKGLRKELSEARAKAIESYAISLWCSCPPSWTFTMEEIVDDMKAFSKAERKKSEGL